MHCPEIVSPGGSYNKAMVAAKYGADAVYVGVPYTSLRMRQNKLRDFDILAQTVNDLHAQGTKAYLTMNIFPRNTDISIFESIVERISDLDMDAIIFSDPGTFTILKKYLPKVRLHLSTQANTLNYEAIKFRQDLGVQRVVLARELTLKEIKTIKQKVPGMELEIFVHGSMCIAYSGRCLLGEYFSGRDGNKGECSHVCRYKFNTYTDPTDQLLYTGTVKEEKRNNKHFAVAHDAEGSYIFSSKDLCTIDHLKEIMPYVDGLKIEGRSKGELYVGTVTKAYKHVRDAIVQNTPIDQEIVRLLDQIPHRPYRNGFLFNDIKSAPDGANGVTLESAGPMVQKEYYGLIMPETKLCTVGEKKIKCHRLIVKQHIAAGTKLEYIAPKRNGNIVLQGFFNKTGKALPEVKTTKDEVYVQTDISCTGREIVYGPMRNYHKKEEK